MTDERSEPDRIHQLANQIVFGDGSALAKTKAAFADPTAWIGFIQAIIAAIRECRENRAKRLAKRMRRRRTRAIMLARLTGAIEFHMKEGQEPGLAQEQAAELAERTIDKANSMNEGELVEVIEELQDTMAW